MNKELIITRNELNNGNEYVVSSLFENRKMMEVSCDLDEPGFSIGNIYIARVKNVLENINAAFVEIAPGKICYLPLEKMTDPVFTKKISKKKLSQDEELLVQIEKEAVKTKDPVVTTNISLSGKYTVVSHENKKLGISSKLSNEDRKHFLELFAEFPLQEAGLIVRTNAADASDEAVEGEAYRLFQGLQEMIGYALHKKAPATLFETEEPYVRNLKNYYMKDIERILTDDGKIYAKIQKFLKSNQPEDLLKLSLYEDPSWSLSKAYNINKCLEHATRRVVWLKSGANIVIESTEALTVIDVNSGKNIAKKDIQENFRKINLEAAEEIAYQLRLRNISGIIVVDFINLEDLSAQKELTEHLSSLLRKDTVKTQFIDITKLGLVEITRKKTRKTLGEQIKYD